MKKQGNQKVSSRGNGMTFEEEVHRAVKHQASLDADSQKTEGELLAIEAAVLAAVSSGAYDFSRSESIILMQSNGKKRFVKQFIEHYSPESILCQCIKQILDRTFKVKYPNRNKSVRALFDAFKSVKQMSDFTIIKYDFKNYFNSVSATYVYEKFIKKELSDRFEADLIRCFAKETKYAFAGFSTSNVVAEIIAQRFDAEIRLAFASKGIIFFERYIDDSIIIFNEHIEESECRNILDSILDKVFHDGNIATLPKCKTKFNDSKFAYISRRKLAGVRKVIDYLGYEFRFSIHNNSVEVKYGITQVKMEKYNKRLDEIILLYRNPIVRNGAANPDYHNMELLRHRIAAFTSRSVYQSCRYNTIIWKAKGFIGNYGELRYLLDTQLIDAKSKTFLLHMVEKAFRRAGLPMPYFINGSIDKSGYNLFENMKANKTLLFIEHIGYSKHALQRLCSQIGINLLDYEGKMRSYGSLVREYLIRVKVGY